MYLLQNVKYFKDDDPTAGIVLLIGVGAIIVVALVVSLIRKGSTPAGMGKTGGGGGAAPRQFNGFVLRRLAASYGLDREQTKLLEFIFRSDGVADPERVLSNPVLLDRHFKRACRTMGSGNEESAQQRLSQLFSLRNAIESVPGSENSGKISSNMSAVLFTGRDSFPVKVISVKGEEIQVENPHNALGTTIRIPKGSRVTLSFFTKASSGFSYDSRVTGSKESSRGPALQLLILGKPKALAKRKFKRKQAALNCSFFFVFAEETGSGRNRQQKLVVDQRRFSGTVQDISVGGCSMKSAAAIRVGSRLKLEIDSPNSPLITCLGQVLRINRSGSVGTIIHIKFIKVPRRAFNTINMLVYGYDD